MAWFVSRQQPVVVSTDEPEESELTITVLDTDCAWCLREQGIEPQSGSHGICTTHSDQVYEAYRANRRAR